MDEAKIKIERIKRLIAEVEKGLKEARMLLRGEKEVK